MTDTTRTPTPVDAVAERWVDTELELFPELHVYLGRPGREGDYADYSPAGAEHAIAETKKALAAIRAATPLDDVDRVTKMDLTRELELAIERHDAGFEQRDLNVIASPAQELREIFDLMPTGTPDDWDSIAKRMHNLPAAMDGYIETLRSGIAAGNVPAIRQVREIITQADKQVADTGFFFGLRAGRSAGDAELPESLKADLAVGAREAADAYAELSAFLDERTRAARAGEGRRRPRAVRPGSPATSSAPPSTWTKPTSGASRNSPG